MQYDRRQNVHIFASDVADDALDDAPAPDADDYLDRLYEEFDDVGDLELEQFRSSFDSRVERHRNDDRGKPGPSRLEARFSL